MSLEDHQQAPSDVNRMRRASVQPYLNPRMERLLAPSHLKPHVRIKLQEWTQDPLLLLNLLLARQKLPASRPRSLLLLRKRSNCFAASAVRMPIGTGSSNRYKSRLLAASVLFRLSPDSRRHPRQHTQTTVQVESAGRARAVSFAHPIVLLSHLSQPALVPHHAGVLRTALHYGRICLIGP